MAFQYYQIREIHIKFLDQSEKSHKYEWPILDSQTVETSGLRRGNHSLSNILIIVAEDDVKSCRPDGVTLHNLWSIGGNVQKARREASENEKTYPEEASHELHQMS